MKVGGKGLAIRTMKTVVHTGRRLQQQSRVNESPWLGLLDAPLVDVDGISCSRGDGRAIDFVVVSRSLLPQVKVSVEWGHPWSPHAALRITLRWDLEAMHKWVPKRPSQWSLGGLHQLPTADFDDILLQTKEKLARDPQFSAASIYSQQYWSWARATEEWVTRAGLNKGKATTYGRGAPVIWMKVGLADRRGLPGMDNKFHGGIHLFTCWSHRCTTALTLW